MTGKLYVIGVGPGDPELITLKAARILRQVPCLCVPRGRQEGESLALSIVAQVVEIKEQEIIAAYFPMRKTRKDIASRETACPGAPPAGELEEQWRLSAGAIAERLKRGLDVAFITLGDPGLYSTFFYLLPYLADMHPGLSMEIIPGVSALNAAAAQALIPLGQADEKIAILPANYRHDLEDTLRRFDTVILMKVQKSFPALREILKRLDLMDRAIYVLRLGLEGERIIRNLAAVTSNDLDYFSLLIIRNPRVGK